MRFQKPYWQLFVDGKKSTTIRSHEVVGGFHSVFCGSYYKPILLGKVNIGLKKVCKLRELSNEDAELDGFKSRDELTSVLMSLNPKLKLDDDVWVYRMKEAKG